MPGRWLRSSWRPSTYGSPTPRRSRLACLWTVASGKITPTFKKALGECGFTAFWGDDASVQPGHLQELMLHATAVAWLRVRLERTLSSACWRATTEAFGTRLRACCADVNANPGVEALCRDFPKRVQLLLDQGGGRLKE